MTCDDFLPALETGGFWRRRAARRHAAHCLACAQTLARWQALKEELRAAPALTDRQRDLWASVLRRSEVRVRWNYARPSLAFALAAAVLLLVCWWSLRHRPNALPTPSPKPSIEVASISPQSIAREVLPLEQALQQMETELAALSQRAALVDLKRQAEKLLEEYQHW